jgi:arylsulfatase A-like enzyme
VFSLCRFYAEPTACLPSGRSIFTVQIVHNNVNGTVTVIFYENEHPFSLKHFWWQL